MATVDREHRTELHYAACEGDLILVQTLLSNGADPNAQDSQGWSPLHFAAQAASVSVTKALLAAGARTELRDSFGNTALSRAVFCSKGDGAVIAALRDAGANVQAENSSGVTPVALARNIANYDVAQFFTDVPAG